MFDQGTADGIAAIRLPSIQVHIVFLDLHPRLLLTDLEYCASEAVVEEPIMRIV